MDKKWTLTIVIVLVATLVIAVVVRLLLRQALLNLLSVFAERLAPLHRHQQTALAHCPKRHSVTQPSSMRPPRPPAAHHTSRAGLRMGRRRIRISRSLKCCCTSTVRLVTKGGARVVSAAGEGTENDGPAGLLTRRLIDGFSEYERLNIGPGREPRWQANVAGVSGCLGLFPSAFDWGRTAEPSTPCRRAADLDDDSNPP